MLTVRSEIYRSPIAARAHNEEGWPPPSPRLPPSPGGSEDKLADTSVPSQISSRQSFPLLINQGRGFGVWSSELGVPSSEFCLLSSVFCLLTFGPSRIRTYDQGIMSSIQSVFRDLRSFAESDSPRENDKFSFQELSLFCATNSLICRTAP
jgi:hypothetical protein